VIDPNQTFIASGCFGAEVELLKQLCPCVYTAQRRYDCPSEKFYLIDSSKDVVVQRRNLNAMARKIGAMKQWEEESG
jgi:hypothetical protein